MFNFCLSIRQIVANATIKKPKQLKEVLNTIFTQFIQDKVKLHQGQTGYIWDETNFALWFTVKANVQTDGGTFVKRILILG